MTFEKLIGGYETKRPKIHESWHGGIMVCFVLKLDQNSIECFVGVDLYVTACTNKVIKLMELAIGPRSLMVILGIMSILL